MDLKMTSIDEILKFGLRPKTTLKYCYQNKNYKNIHTKVNFIKKQIVPVKNYNVIQPIDLKKNFIYNFVFSNIKKIQLKQTIEEFESDMSSSEDEDVSDLEYD